MENDIGVACQNLKGYRDGMPKSIETRYRDDIKVKVNIRSPVYPYIFFTLRNCSTKKKDVGMRLCIFDFTFISSLHCKNIWVTSTIISVTSVACVWGMHHEVQGMVPVF